MNFLAAMPLFISLATSLMIVNHVRSGAEVAPWLAIIVLSGAVLGTATLWVPVGVLVVPTGILFSTACNKLATSKQTEVSSC